MTTSASTLNHESSSRDEHGTFKALLVVAGGVVAALHVWKLSPALGTLSEQLNMSLGQAGVLVAVIQVAGMVLGMIVGLFNDSIGLRRGCLWGFGFLAVGSVLGAMARGPGLLLASRVLEGVGFLVVCVASPALIRRLVPPRRLAPIVGLWGCFFPVAAAISQLTGGFLVDTIGWRAWWLGAAALAVAVGVAMAAVIPPDASTAPRRGNDGGPRAASSSVAATSTTDTLPPAARSVGVRAKATLSTGPLWAAALVMGCYTAQWNGVIQFLPTIYAEAGIAAGAAGALSAGAAACNALGNLSARQALGRGVKPVTLWTIGFVTMAVCAVIAFGIAPLIAEEWRFGLRYGAVIGFSAVGGLIPSTAISQQMALAPAPDTVSTSLGLGQQFNALGQFAGPVAVAFLVQNAGGWHATWWVTVSFAVVGLLASWWLGFAHRTGPTLSSGRG